MKVIDWPFALEVHTVRDVRANKKRRYNKLPKLGFDGRMSGERVGKQDNIGQC